MDVELFARPEKKSSVLLLLEGLLPFKLMTSLSHPELTAPVFYLPPEPPKPENGSVFTGFIEPVVAPPNISSILLLPSC